MTGVLCFVFCVLCFVFYVLDSTEFRNRLVKECLIHLYADGVEVKRHPSDTGVEGACCGVQHRPARGAVALEQEAIHLHGLLGGV